MIRRLWQDPCLMLRQRLGRALLRPVQRQARYQSKMVIAQEFKAEEYDAVQLDLMEERCIVLDREDNPIGEASKKTCAPLHYAVCVKLSCTR